ncbi:uncharacterized protein DDB_G0284459 [Anabrus simplex]|uniref:uncharacterized protein DDB_G0284459 n=1 Tax=Anabrus simplex TaxID=316456 RepID=UPI0035A26C75
MASLEKISNTISGTLHNKETSLLEKSRLGNELAVEENELAVQEAVFPVKKRKKNSDSPENDVSTKRKRKKNKPSEASKKEREVKVKLKEMKMKLQKEKLKQEKMELEGVILRLQRAKLLLEMEKLSEERERIAVEKSIISLRYDILSLHSQFSGLSSHVTWRPCSSSGDNNKEDSTFVTANTVNNGTLSSNSKTVGTVTDPTVKTSSLGSQCQKKLTHLSATDNSVPTNLGLASNSSVSEAHRKVPVFYLCSTDPNMKGNIGIAAPLHAGQVKKGVLSRKKSSPVAVEPRQQPAPIAIQPRIQHPQTIGAQPSVVTSKVSVMVGEPELPPMFPCVKNRSKERFILPATSMLENTVVSRTSAVRLIDTRSFSAFNQPWKQITNTDSVQHSSVIVSDKFVGNKLNKGEDIIIPDNLYDDERTEVKLELQSNS